MCGVDCCSVASQVMLLAQVCSVYMASKTMSCLVVVPAMLCCPGLIMDAV